MSDEAPLPPPPPEDPQTIPPAGPPVLSYAQPGDERPGILTALGVLSIVFGALQVLSNLCDVTSSIEYLFLPGITGAVTFTPTTTPTSASATVVLSPATAPTTVPVNPFAGLPVTPFVIKACVGLAGLALAIYLIVCGSLVLRNRLAGRKHHLRYATLKIILAIPAALAEAWSTYSMQSSVMAAMPSGMTSTSMMLFLGIAVAMVGFWLVISLAYPIAILIVLRVRSVRNYYARLEEVGRY